MKNIKFLTVVLIFIILFSIFAINVNAANNLEFVIIDINGIYHNYISPYATWNEFICKTHLMGLNEEFEIVGNSVVYQNKFLVDCNGNVVNKNDQIYPSLVASYNLEMPSTMLTYDSSSKLLIFDEGIYGLSFGDLADLLLSEGNMIISSALYSNGVYYNGHPIYKGTVLVMRSDTIVKGISYRVDIDTECGHDFYRFKYVEYPSCIGGGVAQDLCALCGFTKTYPVAASSEYHNYNMKNSYDVSCTLGCFEYYCQYCGDVKKEFVEINGHVANDATCDEDSVCNRCGTVVEEALGHDYKILGKYGKCERCGERAGKIGQLGQDAWNWTKTQASNVGNWVKDKATDLGNWTNDKVIEPIKAGLGKAGEIVYQTILLPAEKVIEFVTGGDNGNGGLPGLFNIIRIIFIIFPLVLAVYLVKRFVLIRRRNNKPYSAARKRRGR